MRVNSVAPGRCQCGVDQARERLIPADLQWQLASWCVQQVKMAPNAAPVLEFAIFMALK